MEQTQLISDVQRLVDSLGQLPEPVVKPTIVVVSGLPGTGKSYFSSKLAEMLPFAVLESDALRKTLYPSPNYSADESARLFQVIHSLIEKLLKKGIPVILDATNLSERFRERLYNIADRLGVRLILVSTEAPPEVVHERLTGQGAAVSRSKSDAGWEVYQKMKPTVEKISRRHYVVDTSRDITPVLNKIAREVRH
ncbi:MAG: ATP-binding protein [Chloroflexota bacterium]|nr:ATP-binding protein [Chloroflexota bacterium]